MSSNYINILMTGGGAPGAAGIIKCLKKEKNFHVIAADANPHAVGKFLADEFIQIPLASDPSFINVLLDIARSKRIDVIMPLVTRELNLFAKNKTSFDSLGTKVLVSSHESLEIANDKSNLYQFLEWRGIPVPAFRIAETVEQFREAVQYLGYPAKPVCFKPSISNGSRGFRVIQDHVNELDLLLNHKPDSTYMSLEDALRILSSGKFPELLISEFLPGEEYSVDCIVNNGKPFLIVPRLRKRMINGISVEGEFINDTDITGYCTRILEELKLHGNIGIQVKRAVSGEFFILEINPRVQGTISSALGARINLPVLAIKQELNFPIAENEKKVKWGTKFVRHWEEVFYE